MPNWSEPPLERVQQLLRVGNLDQAIDECRIILASYPKSAQAHHLLGVSLSQNGQHAEAAKALEKATLLSPDNFVFWANLGAAQAGNGAFGAAASSFRRALALNTRVPEAHYNLANALKNLEQPSEAIKEYRKALQLKADYPAAWNNLGALYAQLGMLTDALSAIKRALALKPDNAIAHNNIANVFLYQGNIDACIESCAKALALQPGYLDAFRTMSTAYLAAERYAEAVTAFEEASTSSHAATASYALKMLGVIQAERGYTVEAELAFQRAIAMSPELATRIRHAVMLPPILSSSAEIPILRERLFARLDALATNATVGLDPYKEQIGPNFFLAYHGLNDRDVQIKIASIYQAACPQLNFIAPHCKPAPEAQKPKTATRIGFFSKHIHKHSVAISFIRVIELLSQNSQFSIHIVSPYVQQRGQVSELFPGFKGTVTNVLFDLASSQKIIAALELDILIYLDLGMEPLSFLLAFARLAPVQCVMGGHPVTSGIPNIDYFLSPAVAEPDDAQSHYSETLVRLMNGGFYFARPQLPTTMKSRAELGLPLTGKIYLCPMMLQKIHPDFDGIISNILSLDEESHVVLFESPHHSRWNELISARLDHALPADNRARAMLHPWVASPDDLALIISIADVVIDPVHFGIGSTAIPVFSVGTPLVTWPGEFMRGRVGFAYCKMLDTMECVAENFDDYALKAVEIANNHSLRLKLKNKILANNHIIFENTGAASELAAIIENLVSNPQRTQGSVGQEAADTPA
jgi:protein O-GlcNAc transferase